ncbi:hypothetical protein AVEN_179747-1 [Araneus ventricosus]|uniref:Uncharacterized protein n=1 Tax=Araneus ventricosus TaxID=182803 RepID=A0A4Y2G948_ARAVE|nr:hypothetical protein AVEN_179747-1 [Araneus ventricosus]
MPSSLVAVFVVLESVWVKQAVCRKNFKCENALAVTVDLRLGLLDRLIITHRFSFGHLKTLVSHQLTSGKIVLHESLSLQAREIPHHVCLREWHNPRFAVINGFILPVRFQPIHGLTKTLVPKKQSPCLTLRFIQDQEKARINDITDILKGHTSEKYKHGDTTQQNNKVAVVTQDPLLPTQKEGAILMVKKQEVFPKEIRTNAFASPEFVSVKEEESGGYRSSPFCVSNSQ